MRMLAADVDLQLQDHFEGELVLGQHSPHGLREDLLRLALAARGGRLTVLARIAGVPRVLFLFPLVGITKDDLLGVEVGVIYTPNGH